MSLFASPNALKPPANVHTQALVTDKAINSYFTISKPKPYASEPFNRADADIVLLSSDAVQFSCHRSTLRIASSVFNDMLTLGDATPSGENEKTEGGLPIVPVTEDSTHLNKFLRMIYPVPDPVVAGIKDVTEILEVGRKYQVEIITQSMTKALQKHVNSEPLRVYAVACGLELENEAKLAAIQALSLSKTNISSLKVPEIDRISAGSYFRLLWYHRNRGSVNAHFRFIHRSTRDGTHTAKPPTTSKDNMEPGSRFTSSGDVIFRTTDGVKLRAHQLIISMVSPVLSEKIRCLPLPFGFASPVLDVSEDGQTFSLLLQLCYPLPPPVGLGHIQNVLSAANQYKMTTVAAYIRQQIIGYAQTDPLRVFFIAAANQWKDEVKVAVKHCLVQRQLEMMYVPEMEGSSMGIYQRLLEYYEDMQRKRSDILRRYKEGRRLLSGMYGANAPPDMFRPPRVEDASDITSLSANEEPLATIICRELQALRRNHSDVPKFSPLLEERQQLERELNDLIEKNPFSFP